MHTCHLQLDQLRQQLAQWEAAWPRHPRGLISTGLLALDRVLPEGGLRPGTLIEWLSGVPGPGAGSLAMVCAREICRRGGVLVVVDARRELYPPALAGWGIDLRRLVVVHPQNQRQLEWALVQVFRSPAVAAVWATVGKLDPHAFRRLQLAAKASGAVGLLLRSARVQHQPTWADVQLLVQPLAGYEPRRLRATVVRARGGKTSDPVELILDDRHGELREVSHVHDAHSLPLAAQLADPAPAMRPAGT